jgi:hypothetical protein
MPFSRMLATLALVVLIAAAPGCGGEDADELEDITTQVTDTESAVETAEDLLEDALTIDLEEQNESGITGTATVTPTGTDEFEVTIELEGADEGPQPAHIHPGTCANLDPTPKYPLTSVENGRSETTVEASPLDLVSEELAINVHKSEAEADVYVACGDFPSVE